MACHPARSVLSQVYGGVRPEVDGTSHQTNLRQEPAEHTRLRLQLALEANRMVTLDYDVAFDHFCLSQTEVSETPLEALTGSLDDFLARVFADDRARVESAIRNALDRGHQIDLDARVVVGPKRHIGWLLVSGVVLRDDRGDALRIIGVARDNTARKEGEAVRRAQARGERLRALGEMASGIAHDLSQSLALITGYSDMVRQELGLE